MATDDLRIFLQERLRAFDPNIDLSEGSAAMRQVVSPTVSRFSPDPLEPNFLKFALTRLQQEFPQLFTREGSALADMLIKPMQVLAEPFRREIRAIRRQLSLAYPENLNRREADDLMFNVFARRNSGDFSRVKVRIYYAHPVSVTVGSANFAYTANGLRFTPSVPQRITAAAMLLNQDGDLYYMDVSFVSEAPGARYNIPAGGIIGVTGLTAATRATNLARATSGVDEETTAEFIVRGEQGLGERSIITIPGAVKVLFEEFSELLSLKLVGFNDPDMQRDVIKGNSLGPILYHSFDGSAPDDGHIDSYTSWFDSATGEFTSRLGPVGTDISDYTLTVVVDAHPYDYQLGYVLGATRVSINAQYEGSDRLLERSIANLVWMIRKCGTITLSEIPGGILFPSAITATSEVKDDEVHVGGCADFFVRGGTTEETALAIQLIADESVATRGEDARTATASDIVSLDDLSEAVFSAAVEVGHTLYLETGANQGAYRITSIVSATKRQVRIQVPDVSLIQIATDLSFVVIDDLDIDLLEPKDVRYAASDLRTYGGSALVDTDSGVPDFSAIGVVDTDYVEIINGTDWGEYAIAAGGVSANEIVLESPMTQTASPIQYRIYSKSSGITLPLLRVKDVELLDSSLNPRGITVPYGDAVDVRSESFQNPGRGAKAGTSVAALGDTVSRLGVGDEDLIVSSEALNYYDLGVRVGDQVNIETSDNQGYYVVTEVGGDPGSSLSGTPAVLRVDRNLAWYISGMSYLVGSPSVGTMRAYFLHPCTAEFSSADTVFSVESAFGTRTFRPDPDVYHGYLPNGTTIPTAGISAASDQIALVQERGGVGSEVSAELHGVGVGDRVSITYAPIVGAIDLSSNVDVDGLTFRIDLGSGTETVTLSGASVSIDAIVSQLNAGLSQSVVEKYERTSAPAGKYIMIRSSSAITIYGDGTVNAVILDDPGAAPNSRTVFHPWLTGEFDGSTTTNDAPDQGIYEVSATITNLIDLIDLSGAAFNPGYTIETELGHYSHFSVRGVQRISSTEMQNSMDDLGFYYVDVECVSIGYGDTWNIEVDVQATVSGHRVEGWTISVENANLSYSMVERPWLHVTPRILPVGSDDDPANYLELTGSSIQATYERTPLVSDVSSFISADTSVRVLTSSPLARSLLPTFVRIAISYRGGYTAEDARGALADAIAAVLPDGELTVSSLTKILDDSGSTYIRHPITLVGVTHQTDRSIIVERSEDALSVGALSMLMPDDDDLTVEGASYLFLTRLV